MPSKGRISTIVKKLGKSLNIVSTKGKKNNQNTKIDKAPYFYVYQNKQHNIISIKCIKDQLIDLNWMSGIRSTKKKFDQVFKKDLTPKHSKFTPKINPVYSSFRSGLTIKPDLSVKPKASRPSTSKYSTDPKTYFHSHEDKKHSYSSTKKIQRQSLSRGIMNNNHQEYQPRAKSKSPIKQPDQIVRQQMEVKYPSAVSNDREIRYSNNKRPNLPKFLTPISNFEKAKHSLKSNGAIKAYAASTNQGPVRDYNEDRVAIILNIARPEHCKQWKKAAYFGVFDGHGGVDCADFLRDNLHVFVSKERSFPDNMPQALKDGFDKCEKNYIQLSKHNKVDHSGSCAVVTFFYGDKLYVANCGDSRAIMSTHNGNKIADLSIDHKASDEYQQKRIFDAGGKIYQTKLQNANPNMKIFYEGQEHNFILGPHRVMPGRLSVTRTFGDIEAKLPQFRGNPKGIINEPEIRMITISGDQDFVLLASDGIFDKMDNDQVITIVWDTFKRDEGKFKNLHQFCGIAVENIMKLAFHKKTLDNITVAMVALQGLQRYYMSNCITTVNTQNNFYKTMVPQSRREKTTTKNEGSLQRKYIGRSTSPSNYRSLKPHFYKS